jgi:hypothetical protein
MTKLETIVAELKSIPEDKLDILYDFVHQLALSENQQGQKLPPKPGKLKGNFTISEKFDEPLEEFNEYQ